MFKDLSGFRKGNRLQRSKNRLVKPIRILWSKSRQLVVMTGTKLMAVGMEKIEFGHDLGPGVVGKGKSPS